MPDFTARLTAGVTLTAWDDHAGAGVSRLNPLAALPSRYQRATVGVMVEMRATVGGVEGPADGALGGALFTSDVGESPEFVLPTSPAGFTSIQRFTPVAAGHYLWVMRHAGGGAVAIHLDAEV